MGNIIIFTVFRNTNYGAGLQAYALQTKLKKVTGEQVYLIDYIKNNTTNLMHNGIIFYGKHSKKSIKSESIKKMLKSILNYRGTVKRTKIFQQFIDNSLCVYPKKFYEGDVISVSDLDYIILGSDQIWNPDVMRGFHNPYFGIIESRAKSVIAYAPSIGKLTFSNVEEKELKNRLRNVDLLSCREEKSCEYLKKLTNRNVKCVLDPTLLLNRDEWSDVADTKCLLPEKYVLVYSLRYDVELAERAVKYAQGNGCKVIFLGTGSGKTIPGTEYCREYGPKQFISAIMNAECIYTDSFHGTVFSIIFNKKFVVRAYGEKGQRMESLCNLLDLNERVFKDYSCFPDMENEIDYTKVMSKLTELKEKSEKYIYESLNLDVNKLEAEQY